MKFRISTILVATAFVAIALFGVVGVLREKEKQAELSKQVADANQTIAELNQRIESAVNEQERKLASIDHSLNFLADAQPDSKPKLVWLDNRSYYRNSRSIYPEKNMSWRLFIPEGGPEIELCVKVGEIPRTGFPLKCKRYPASETVRNEAGEEVAWDAKKDWHGHLVIEFVLSSYEFPAESKQGFQVFVATRTMDEDRPWRPKHFCVSDSFLHATPVEDMKWFPVALADVFTPRSAESWKVNHVDVDDVDFSKPIELFRIRGKRLIDGEFQITNGPASGMMAWLQLKQVGK